MGAFLAIIGGLAVFLTMNNPELMVFDSNEQALSVMMA